MKAKWIGGALLSLASVAAPAGATSFSFDGNNLQTFTATSAGEYEITAYGASGGSTSTTSGGLGAAIGGIFTLTAGETLDLYVGGAGGSDTEAGGGGGGTFVLAPGSALLVVAGGGGGGGTSTNGGAGLASASGAAGGNSGGFAGAGGGGGFSSNGASGTPGGQGGDGFPTLIGGLASTLTSNNGNGGFGGGGGASPNGGGGGGGYSGGNGGNDTNDSGGLGGSSFDTGFDQLLTTGANSGNGSVVITEVSTVSEPSTFALMGLPLLGCALIRRKKRPCA